MPTLAIQRFTAKIDAAQAGDTVKERTLTGKEASAALTEILPHGVSVADADAALDALYGLVDTAGRKKLIEFLGQRSYSADLSQSSEKFETKLDAALADGKITKTEARALRKLALADLKTTDANVSATDGYKSTFMCMLDKADSPATTRYIADVGAEFRAKTRYEQASRALRHFLVANPGHPLSEAVDLSKPFTVGNSLNRGIWLDVQTHDGADFYDTRAGLRDLFKTEAALQQYGEIYVI